MARADWLRERDEAMRHEAWSAHGPNRVVKVVPLSAASPVEPPAQLGGFITLAKWIRRMTPDEINRALGLPQNFLKGGATVYSFSRCPQPSEYDHELTADHPDGLAYTWMSDRRYPPGSRVIHQWRIRDGCEIPVAAGREVRLLPGQRFLG